METSYYFVIMMCFLFPAGKELLVPLTSSVSFFNTPEVVIPQVNYNDCV